MSSPIDVIEFINSNHDGQHLVSIPVTKDTLNNHAEIRMLCNQHPEMELFYNMIDRYIVHHKDHKDLYDQFYKTLANSTIIIEHVTFYIKSSDSTIPKAEYTSVDDFYNNVEYKIVQKYEYTPKLVPKTDVLSNMQWINPAYKSQFLRMINDRRRPTPRKRQATQDSTSTKKSRKTPVNHLFTESQPTESQPIIVNDDHATQTVTVTVNDDITKTQPIQPIQPIIVDVTQTVTVTETKPIQPIIVDDDVVTDEITQPIVIDDVTDEITQPIVIDDVTDEITQPIHVDVTQTVTVNDEITQYTEIDDETQPIVTEVQPYYDENEIQPEEEEEEELDEEAIKRKLHALQRNAYLDSKRIMAERLNPTKKT